jgi:hypothetical protein
MIINGYTIYDRKALSYSPPFFVAADGMAVRMFSDLVGDPNTQVGRHPGDFVLYRCGGYDDSNGSLLPVTALQHIVDAMALVPRAAPLPFDPEPRHATRTAGNGAARSAQDHTE